MSLKRLPNEIIFRIAESLERDPRNDHKARKSVERDLNAFAQTNRRLYSSLNSHLYRHNLKYACGSGMAWAAKNGRKATVQRFLSELSGGSSNTPFLGATVKEHRQVRELLQKALDKAARKGHEEIVKLLLDKATDVEGTARFSSLALKAAASSGKVSLVESLIDMGADVNFFDSEDRTSVVQLACRRSSLDVVRVLLNKGADINTYWYDWDEDAQHSITRNVLCIALERGDEQFVKYLLEKGANVNSDDEKIGEYGTVLQFAVHEAENIVELLLDHGADINKKGRMYMNLDYSFHEDTALCAAAWEGRERIVKLLLEKGADVEEQGAYGNPLIAAAGEGHDNIVKMLLDHGANINALADYPDFGQYDYFSARALYVAVIACKGQTVELLLQQKGIDVNLPCGHYGYALQAAAAMNSLRIFQLLLDHGADVNAQGGWYGTALRAAVEQGGVQIVEILLNQKDIDVNVRRKTYGEDNSLIAAARKGFTDIVRLLLEKGADTKWKGPNGTALEEALSGGKYGVVEILRKHKN